MTETSASGRVGWYYGWNIVAVCVLISFSPNALPINCFSLFLRDWARDLQTPVSTLQLGVAAVGIGTALLSPLAGVLIDRCRARPLLVAGLAGAALFYLAMGSVRASWQFLALYAVLLPVAMVLAATLLTNTVISRWFGRRIGLALSIATAGPGIASIALPPLVAALIPLLGWRWIWRSGGVLIAVLVLPLVLAVLRERPDERERSGELDAASALHRPAAADGGGDLRLADILSRPLFWLVVLTYLPMLGLYLACGANIAPIAALRGFDRQTAAMLLSLMNLAHVGSMLVAGALSDRFGARPPLAGLAFATAAGGLLLAAAPAAPLLAAAVVLVGCGGSFWPLITSAIAREFGSPAVGRVFGLAIFFLPLTSLAPFALARSQELTGSYAPALLVMSLLAASSGAACLLLMRERRGGLSEAAARAS